MRGRVAATAVGLSLALHGVFALVLARRQVRWPRPPAALSIDLTIQRRTTPRPGTPPPASPHQHSAATLLRDHPRSSRATEPPKTAPARTDRLASSDASRPSGAPTPPVDLFPDAALQNVVRPASPQAIFGGHLRRATDPVGAGADAREEAAQRVHDIMSDLVGRERVQSGRLAPRWRAIERQLSQSFHPPLAAVKRESVAKAFAHQVLRAWLRGPPRTGTVARGVDASVETLLGTPPGFNMRALPEEQALASQARWADPASWLRVIVEVTIDADGRILRTRVLMPSGRRAFDRVACHAVESAVRAGGPPDERRSMTSRWSVEAAVAVAPPTAVGLRFDESGTLSPGAHGVRKYLAPVYPFQQSVRTHVSLVSLVPAP